MIIRIATGAGKGAHWRLVHISGRGLWGSLRAVIGGSYEDAGRAEADSRHGRSGGQLAPEIARLGEAFSELTGFIERDRDLDPIRLLVSTWGTVRSAVHRNRRRITFADSDLRLT